MAIVPGSAYLGCYEDFPPGSMLRDDDNNFHDTNTPAKCANFCKDYKYFGVEYGFECYCGNVLHHNKKKDEGDCKKKCSGDNSQTCGAFYRINVYEIRSSKGMLIAGLCETVHLDSIPIILTGNQSFRNQ